MRSLLSADPNEASSRASIPTMAVDGDAVASDPHFPPPQAGLVHSAPPQTTDSATMDALPSSAAGVRAEAHSMSDILHSDASHVATSEAVSASDASVSLTGGESGVTVKGDLKLLEDPALQQWLNPEEDDDPPEYKRRYFREC